MMNYLWPIFCYLFSSIPQSYLIVKKVAKKDIRLIGREKLSASNVIQNIGFFPGILVGLFDILKGVLAVWGAKYFGLNPYSVALSGLLALCGQMWPIFLNFWGGRGGSVFLGALLMLSLKAFFIFVFVWVLFKLLWKGYGASVGMSLGILLSFFFGLYYRLTEIIIFSGIGFLLVHLQRVLAKPGSLKEIKDKKIILWRLFLDRDTKRP
jgi:glycerol-3-phosphate acyltransferase PlsY